MIPSARGEGADTKQDHVGTSHDKAQTSSRTWSALKNPRIVRVSRTLGGKDRHSKVRTIKGLRDRRVRLSIPTAIQLYDLQDKLGLNQPSKVVDWLLSAAQHEIDKLPPLEMLQGSLFDQFPQSLPNQAACYSGQASLVHDDEYTIPSDEAQRLASRSGILNNNANVEDTTMLQKSVSNSLDVLMRSKEREAVLAKEMSMERGNNITEGLHNVKHHGFALENINANTYSPCYHLLETPTSVYSSHGQSEVLPHGYHPIAIVANSYMAAASNVGSKQYGNLQVASSASQDVPSDHALRTSLHAAIPDLMVLHKNSTTSSKHHNHDQT